ncbi:nuclear transport factor 2 family protein [Variovorax sp. E3]|uniref:nuclear transport factor 2 family protein n=1 Tax=Variovorax sp. E3 TaxID=1914993 RepID=UPI0035B2D3FD
MSNSVIYLRDRADIHDVLMRYFNAADSGRKDLVRNCFTEDVTAQYEGRPQAHGVDALMAQIALFDNLVSGACRVSTHFAGNLVFKSQTEELAETEHNVFAFLVNSDGTTVLARSLRYLDRLKRVNGEWRIFARLHTLDWSCEMPCTFARAFALKARDFPADWPTGR